MDITPDLAERAQAGSVLTPADLDILATSDVLSLGLLADDRRRATVGDTVTYVRVHEVSPSLEPAPDAAGEVRLTVLRETLDATVEAVQTARHLAGSRLLTGFSLAELVNRAGAWGGLRVALERLKAAGLDAVAEAPVDRLTDAASVLQSCEDAGVPVRCLSVADPVASRSALIVRVRTLVQRFPALQTFAPLPRTQSATTPTTGYDDVRAVALARLGIPTLRRIQVDWVQYGPKLAQVALTFGANDLDRVSAVDDDSLGRRRTAVEDVKRNITAAGFAPVERDQAP